MTGLRTRGLSVRLGGATVLDDVSLDFGHGRVTAVLGPNGAGKSSLLSCLAGLRRPDEGQVMLDGVPLTVLAPRARARSIGLLPQSGEVHWDVDVATLVALGRFPHRGRWGETEEDRAAVTRAMAATDVTRFAHRPVTRLSGGERSRVLLARVLAGEPEWLLADEPLASLDPAHQLDVLDRLRGVAAAGAGVIVVLHDLNQAARVADEVLLLRAGRVVAMGPPDDVLTEALLAETYGVAVDIGRTADGCRFVIPVRRIG
ncbi:ABC transporter [Sphingomonas oleivorans]|uniref:ABC transporter n=1 Tax=Sphingomonas oleivorans TaxID=1735121 RepID=A0A2T5G296_9SPHN|nr:ABC transporter ATP-binding protein [Sphingomonas oleivorans]PTQ13264.1 ABC transporter [Sphingomonas oleivorans]